MESINSQKKIKYGRIKIDSLDLLLLLAICEKNIVRYVLYVFRLIPGLPNLNTIILHTIYILLFFISFYKQKIKLNKNSVVFLFLAISNVLFSAIIYPENSIYIFNSNNFWEMIFPCLRYFLIGYAVCITKERSDVIAKASCIGIIIEAIYAFTFMRSNELLATDDMSRSYQLLFNVLFVLNYTLSKKKIIPFICSIIGFIYLLAMGTRGPIIIFLSCFFILMIYKIKGRFFTKTCISFLIVLIFYLIFISNLYVSFLNISVEFFEKIGVSTRVLDFALKGDIISYTSGRDQIYEIALEKIKESPFVGYGLYGEWKWFNWNVHNLYLETFIHYGVIIGSLLLLWLIVIVCNTFLKTKSTYVKELIIVLTCIVFIKGIFGGSFYDKWVFFLIGICMNKSNFSKGESIHDKTSYCCGWI